MLIGFIILAFLSVNLLIGVFVLNVTTPRVDVPRAIVDTIIVGVFMVPILIAWTVWEIILLARQGIAR